MVGFKGLGNTEAKVLGQGAYFEVLWYIWVEQNAHIFKDTALHLDLLWGKIAFS